MNNGRERFKRADVITTHQPSFLPFIIKNLQLLLFSLFSSITRLLADFLLRWQLMFPMSRPRLQLVLAAEVSVKQVDLFCVLRFLRCTDTFRELSSSTEWRSESEWDWKLGFVLEKLCGHLYRKYVKPVRDVQQSAEEQHVMQELFGDNVIGSVDSTFLKALGRAQGAAYNEHYKIILCRIFLYFYLYIMYLSNKNHSSGSSCHQLDSSSTLSRVIT